MEMTVVMTSLADRLKSQRLEDYKSAFQRQVSFRQFSAIEQKQNNNIPRRF